MALKQTPSQTVGPFFSFGLAPVQYGYGFAGIAGGTVASPDTAGQHIQIVGRVLDGEGQALSDALIEIWQADAEGRYAHPADTRSTNAAFSGFGRMGTGTEADHRFIFETVMPGPPSPQEAPHINVLIFARGMLNHLYTRIYFEDHTEANASDPVLQNVPENRRQTLVARRDTTMTGRTYRFDIRLQGADETVFFDV